MLVTQCLCPQSGAQRTAIRIGGNEFLLDDFGDRVLNRNPVGSDAVFCGIKHVLHKLVFFIVFHFFVPVPSIHVKHEFSLFGVSLLKPFFAAPKAADLRLVKTPVFAVIFCFRESVENFVVPEVVTVATNKIKDVLLVILRNVKSHVDFGVLSCLVCLVNCILYIPVKAFQFFAFPTHFSVTVKLIFSLVNIYSNGRLT